MLYLADGTVALRELALEEVRKEKYPQYSSRMGCLYVSKTFEEAVSLKKYHANTAKKRNTHFDVALDELEKYLTGGNSVEYEILAKELQQSMNDFIIKLKKADRVMFVRRYWFLETVSEIVGSIGRSNNYVTVHLHRSRKKLYNLVIKKA